MKLVITFEVELTGDMTVGEALSVLRPARETYIAALQPLGRARCKSIQPEKKHGAKR